MLDRGKIGAKSVLDNSNSSSLSLIALSRYVLEIVSEERKILCNNTNRTSNKFDPFSFFYSAMYVE